MKVCDTFSIEDLTELCDLSLWRGWRAEYVPVTVYPDRPVSPFGDRSYTGPSLHKLEAMVQRGIELADLGDRIDSKVDTYSKGMMRRLLIARAIMPSPKLAILDEVTSGLDVINSYEIREIIRSIASTGVTVVMSSHNMFEVDMLCDRVGMIDQGNLILLGTPAELKAEYGVDTLEEVFVKAVRG